MNRFHLIFIFVLCCIEMMSATVFARPTKEEKSKRRAEYWGLYSDLYRGFTCINLQVPDFDCFEHALKHAKIHAINLDQMILQEEKLVNRIEKIQLSYDAKNFDISSSHMNEILLGLSSEFSGSIAPVVQPDFSKGEALFQEFCQSCHGDGRGSSGSLTSSLKRKPLAFDTTDRAKTLTPFGVYASMIHGIEKSEMTSMLDVLDVDELWAVAFFVATLQTRDSAEVIDSKIEEKITLHKAEFALSNMALATNQNIVSKLQTIGVDCEKCEEEVTFIRKHWVKNISAVRLGESAQTPVQKAESRALKLLMIVVTVVSLGFYFVLRRRSRIK